MITDGRAKGWWPRGENIWIGPMPSLPGVRSPPLHKMANRCDGRLRGKPGDGAEGGFLGGARSPRPDCKAELAPWHSISTRWGARGGWPTGDMSRTNPCHPPGVRSPPLRGGGRPEKTAYRERAGDDTKGDFLGGTRSPRPHRTAGRMARHRVATGAFTISQWPKGDNIWISVMPSSGACGARPSAGWTARKDGLAGKGRRWREE
jgi:hypothetical protein